jgi:hypothetical protein
METVKEALFSDFEGEIKKPSELGEEILLVNLYKSQRLF